ncbi:Metal dependent phosphohydrolase [Desulfosarcina cetonica]|uniref:HDOD domain-containing protein n=1 Tax=Desulfosarcina cetonica TaxID=90730 RepID=UPI0009FAAE6A|nr:HDOD domain-containing protein [Desulfosarcina cetonica]VTR67516.1 Metal dependent phosphohydrolase [Desulfosarcina cetonica]
MQKDASLLDTIKAYMASGKAVLPVFSATSLKIQREAAKAEPDTGVIERMIICDPSLTSQILRISNSAFYKGLQKVSTVRAAIVRLGNQEIANIAILVSQKKQFKAHEPFVRALMQQLWRHSVSTAVSAQWIAHRCGLKARAQEAFTAGLLHDMGKLLILTVTDAVKRNGTLHEMPAVVLLSEVMDTFHAPYGYALLRYWNLPKAYCRIARDHHKPEIAKGDDLMAIIRLADRTTNSLGIGLRGTEACVLAATPEADYFGLDEIALAELEIKLEDAKVFW